MITDRSVKELVEQHIAGSDIFLVEISVAPGNSIRVHVDRPEGITVEECSSISRFLNQKIDREVEDYSLEVSSPGLSAPLRVRQQYEKNIGQKVEVHLAGGGSQTGVLQSVGEESVTLKVKGNEVLIRFDEIKKAKAIISWKV
jgi:ribosome maturation factor RimP